MADKKTPKETANIFDAMTKALFKGKPKTKAAKKTAAKKKKK